MGQLFSYVIGVLVAGLVVFGLYFGLHVGSPAYARQVDADRAAEKTLDELAQVLIDGKPSEIRAAITAIGQGDDQLDRRVGLIANATASVDRSVQSICTLSIQRLGDRAKAPIRKLLASSDPAIVQSACGVIRALGTKGDEFAPDMLKLLADGNRYDRHAALYAIQDMSPEALVPGLDNVIKELDDDDFNTQCQACFVLKRMGRAAEPATERLVQLLQEGNVSSRSRAAQALAAIGPVDGFDIPELIGNQLEAGAFMEKVRGLDAIADLGPAAKTDKNLERIQKLIDNMNQNCVAEASLAMYRLTGNKKDTLRKLQDLLQKRNFRTAAAECLGAMGADATAAVPNLIDLINVEDLAVAETAVLALKNIGPTADAALPRLKKLLDHEDFLLSVAAQEAIDAIAPENEQK